MTNAIGLANAKRTGAGEDEDAQNLLGRVRDRGQRVRRQHGEAGDPGEPLVVGEVRGDRLADDEPFELGEETFFGHGILPTADGVS